MKNIHYRKFVLVCIVLVIVALGILNISSQSYDDEWWGEKWHYRFRLDVNMSEFYSPNSKTDRINWPVEYEVNFTDILREKNVTGTFDINSTRVIEYNSTGSVLWEMKSQFDPYDIYNTTSNAIGTLSFILNGTNPANTVRYFYVYFDILENGGKGKTDYQSDFAYNNTPGMEEFNVNNSIMAWFIDTERAENTSGFYRAVDLGSSNEILEPDSQNRTAEYTKYSNGTQDFGFDFRKNFTFKHVGPVRIVVEQKGEETLWGLADNKTGEGFMTKRYIFYTNNTFVKIEQIYKNNATSNITRNSTFASVPGINVSTTFTYGPSYPNYPNKTNATDPGSWAWAGETGGTWSTGIINLEEEGTSNFFASNDVDNTGKIGITLNSTNITLGESIRQVSVVLFNGTGADDNQIKNLKYGLLDNVNITRHPLEAWQTITEGRTYNISDVNVSVFNRNETVVIKANVTTDYYNISKRINATLDMGTTSPNDDVNITLYDEDGDNVYNNSYFLEENASTGVWNITLWTFNDTWYILNKSFFTFNVTDEYFVNITSMKNKTGFPNRIINMTIEVKNYRQDVWIANATINCSYDSTKITFTNFTDYLNGTYFMQFQAPSDYRTYGIVCNATRHNNTGFDTDQFTVEGYTTNLSIVAEPTLLTYDSITWYDNQSFTITANATNLENGSAYYTNITLGLPQNITANTTSESCGPVYIGKSCNKSFSIIVLNGTPPGNYTFNVSVEWRNSIGSYDKNTTTVNVTVLPNYMLDVVPIPDNKISSIVAKEKEKNIGNFTLNSSGNAPVENITFNVTGFDGNFTFEFIPPNVSALSAGELKEVQINLTVSSAVLAGTYNGTLNITSDNDGWRNITIEVSVSGTNMSIVINPDNFTAENITWYVNQSIPLFVNATNIETGVAHNASINLDLPANITSNVSQESCGNVEAGESCVRYFLITVMNGTLPGNYSVNVSVQWENPEMGTSSNVTQLNITVESNVILQIPEDNMTSNVTHGTNVVLGNFTLNSSGNDKVINLSSEITGLDDFNFTFVPLDFNPPNITNVSAGRIQIVVVNVSVPLGYDPGVYNGTLNITTFNAGWENLSIQITVPTSRTWTIEPTYCERPMTPEYGFACSQNVTINNTGNVQLGFNITPQTSESSPVNYTWTNETNFAINKQCYHKFSVLYNTSGAPVNYHNTTYIIDALQAGSNPDYELLKVVLNPFVKPVVEIGIFPNVTEQNTSIRIFANVTDLSGFNPVQNATINITGPDGSNYTAEMDPFGSIGNVYKYEIYFPYDADHGLWGNSSLYGLYNVSVMAFDQKGSNGTGTSDLYVYYKLYVEPETLSQIYYEGMPFGDVDVFGHEFLGSGVKDISLNLSLEDPNGIESNYLFEKPYTFLTTNPQGHARSKFTIPYNNTGNYTLYCNYSYYDSNVNITLQNSTSYQFEVRKESEITARIAIPDPSLIGRSIPISVYVLDNGIPAEPESINVTVYYNVPPYGILEVTRPWGHLNKSDFTETAPGFYTYQSEIINENTTATGTYVAKLEVKINGKPGLDIEAFRISKGGPYDVSVNLLEGQAYQDDFIDFEIYVENRGDVSHLDVKLEYWIYGQNQTWSYGGPEDVNVYAHSNRTFVRNLYIEPTQPLGKYYVIALVTWDTSLPSATASGNASFNVVARGPPAPPGPPGPGEGAPPPAAPEKAEKRAPKIEITKYLQEIGIETGATKYPTVEVENTGGLDLYNVTLNVIGIPTPWIEITPKVVDSLPPGNSSLFTMKLSMPSIAEPKEYFGTLVAEGVAENNKTSDEKMFKIVVFTSREDLVRWEIERLEKALRDFEMDVEDAKSVGKDVSEVEPLVGQIKERVGEAKDYLNKKMYDDALSAVYVGWNLLDRAKYLLSKAPFIQPLVTFIPLWLIIVLVVLIAIIIVLIFFVKKVKGSIENIFKVQLPHMKPTTVVVEKMEERESMEREIARVKRVLNLLEREFKEGMISERAYQGLKARNEEKLASLEKRLSGIS